MNKELFNHNNRTTLSLKELGEMLPSGAISKSGVNHRLRKISEFAQNLKEEKSN